MAADMFLKLDTIQGESTDDTHAKEIEVLAWSWGASQSASGHSGGGSGTGRVAVQDITITKYVDYSTPVLFFNCCSGTHVASGQLTVRKAGGTQPVEYLKIILEKVFISSYSTGGSGGEDRITENVTLNFSKVRVEYTPQEGLGGGAASNGKGWNISDNVEWK
jgi:type VI secretion system secreted protein Hcp